MNAPTRPIEFWPDYERSKETLYGTFHGWGLDIHSNKFTDTALSITIAIVEMPDGSVESVEISRIRRFADIPA